MTNALQITVKGRVQGVSYRQGAADCARSLGITGTVRNLPDGSVEIIAMGTTKQMEELVAWCRQGPPAAKVTELQTKNITHEATERFLVLH